MCQESCERKTRKKKAMKLLNEINDKLDSIIKHSSEIRGGIYRESLDLISKKTDEVLEREEDSKVGA